MHNHHAKLIAICEVRNLDNLETNTRPKDNRTYIKDPNAKSINCKADKIASYYAYCKTLLLLQVQYKNFQHKLLF